MSKFCVGQVRYWRGKYKGVIIATQTKTYTEIHPILKKKVRKCLNTAAFKLIDENPVNKNKVIVTPLRRLYLRKKKQVKIKRYQQRTLF